MAKDVKVPTLGESITSGILATWHVKSGDYVQSGQEIYDLETDKITSEGTAEASGVIELKVEEGDEVEIGAVIAVIDTDAEQPQQDDSPDKEDGDKNKSEEADDKEASEEKGDKEPDGDEQEDVSGKRDSSSTHPPSVRRIAAETGIDPDKVTGSGKDGRVTKGDMLEAAEKDKKKGPANRRTKRGLANRRKNKRLPRQKKAVDRHGRK